MIESRKTVGRAFLVVALLAMAVPAFAGQPEDAWITTKVKMALLTNDVVDGLDVNVDTFDGHVTLHGKVASAAGKLSAETRAREIQGVHDVRNLLAVVPEAARKTTDVADEALSKQVSTVLERDAALEGSDIELKSVSAGVVVLAGKAKTLSAHRRALEDARSVEGVVRVASEIQSPDELGDEEIWGESGQADASHAAREAMSDAWITTKAKLFLLTDSGLSPLAINVDTERGVVTLFGSVGTEAIKARAGLEVAKIDGVQGLRNELQVVPDVAAKGVAATDENMLEAVQTRLGAHESLKDASLDVEVSNRVVRLTGTVTSQRDRLTALTVVRGTDGVESVIDDLVIEPPKS